MGPLFAAFTGVAFKEGVCYGKPECAVLFFLTPALLLGKGLSCKSWYDHILLSGLPHTLTRNCSAFLRKCQLLI